MAFVTVANANELPDLGRIIAKVDGVWVAVFRVGDYYYAIEDQCTHDGESLAETGTLLDADTDNPRVECDRHGATFELKTGKPTFPAVVPVARYPVRIEGDEIQVNVQEPLQTQ
ncbi:MAG: 2Fe-2S ferredoxin [Phototrophicales bacterium]|nr:MAG: 2Fe-2S ferredoxin [Phototrophicales bacterium]